jgi:hypothetical protein
MAEEIILGSGDLYVATYSGTIPVDATLEVAENKLGEISGGASVEYKPSFYTAKSDNGKVTKTAVTDEEATLKTGVCTLSANTLNKLCATGTVTEDTTKHTRTLKIGGIAKYAGTEYVIRFVHSSGDYRVTIVGHNEAGFTLTYSKDKETIVDAEFKAQPHDTDGTLIEYTEYDATITA